MDHRALVPAAHDLSGQQSASKQAIVSAYNVGDEDGEILTYI